MVSSVVSLFDLVAPDLSRYKELLDQLDEANLEVEAALDDLPDSSPPPPERQVQQGSKRPGHIQ